MNTIRLEIKKGNRIRRKYQWQIPASVDEITGKHLAIIADVLDQPGEPMDHRMEILIRLGKITRPDLMNGEHVMASLPLLDFLDDQDFIMERAKIRRIGPFIAPKKRMKNFTGGQMALCDTILQAIEIMGQDDEKKQIPNKILADFCAANCTLIGFSWSNFIADHLAIPFFRYLVPRRKKLAMLIQYRAMRRIFPKQYPNAFNDDGIRERFPSMGWAGTIVRLAGEKFGRPNSVRKTPAHDLFRYLEQAKRDEIRAESLKRKH